MCLKYKYLYVSNISILAYISVLTSYQTYSVYYFNCNFVNDKKWKCYASEKYSYILWKLFSFYQSICKFSIWNLNKESSVFFFEKIKNINKYVR